MNKLIDFLKSLFIKSAASLAKDRADILKTFTDAVKNLEKNAEAAEVSIQKQETIKYKALEKITKAEIAAKALAVEQQQSRNVIAKIEALVS